MEDKYVPIMPRREPGSWLDASDEEETEVGCKTCGWYEVGPYQEVRQKWIEHKHDPIVDIELRCHDDSIVADTHTLRIDIEYLLWRLEQAGWNSGR